MNWTIWRKDLKEIEESIFFGKAKYKVTIPIFGYLLPASFYQILSTLY